jgi:pimeloyl-ACP methyl ester carboxylesterase
MPRSGAAPAGARSTVGPMHRLLVGGLGLALALGVASAGFLLAPSLDGRWETATAARDPSVVEQLTRDARTPLLFVPDSVTRDPATPVTLVVVLPGLGGIGRDLAEGFVPAAEADRWLLLAPSPDYDPKDANESLEAADLRVDNELVALVDRVLARPGLQAAPRIDLVGFSRGAQQAHRFALRHPERVNALASFSAGTYTMPTSLQPYPLGVGGFDQWNHLHPFDPVTLRQVRVLVGVGTADANPADVVRAWDGVGGTTRFERGSRFAQALQQLDVPTRFQTYPGVGHAFVPAMRADAIGWFLGS